MLEFVPADATAIDVPTSFGIGRSFVSGDPEGDRIRIRYFRHCEGILAVVWFGPGAEGPPGCAHGGSVAAVLDEAMGAAAWSSGHAVVAARLTTHFRTMVPLERELVVECSVTRAAGRKVLTQGRLRGIDGNPVYARGEAVFVTLAPERFGALAEEIAARFRALGDR